MWEEYFMVFISVFSGAMLGVLVTWSILTKWAFKDDEERDQHEF